MVMEIFQFGSVLFFLGLYLFCHYYLRENIYITAEVESKELNARHTKGQDFA